MPRTALALILLLCATALHAQVGGTLPPGGANAPEPAPPQAQVLELAALPLANGTIRVPTGTWQGASSGYAVPGPIAGFREQESAPWRGISYLETADAVVAFTGTIDRGAGETWSANLAYTFASGGSYQVQLQTDGGTVRLHETVSLDQPASWVFDAYYGWQPTAGFVIDQEAVDHAALYLPCHYDKAEAHILHDRLMDADSGGDAVAGLAIFGFDTERNHLIVAGFFADAPADWQQGGRMGVALWQHRQLPAHPASRHFLGPETKSDGTPNPYAAPMMGTSAYEGHVTIEFALDGQQRKLGFTAYAHAGDLATVPATFKQEATP